MSDEMQRAIDALRTRVEAAEERRGMRPRQPREPDGTFAPKQPATMSDALRALVADSHVPAGTEAATGKLLTPPEPPTGVSAAFRLAIQRLIRPAGSLNQAVGDYRERTRGVYRSKHWLEDNLPPVPRK